MFSYMKFLRDTKKFVVRAHSELTSLQRYIYCNTKQTAETVKLCFEEGTRIIDQYRWSSNAPDLPKAHWCVTPDVPWVLARAEDVREGERYIGGWEHEKTAFGIWQAVLAGLDSVDAYTDGIGPIEGGDYVIVSVNRYIIPAPVEMPACPVPAETVILPCIDPLERLGKMTSGGLDGFECLRRYEEGQRLERRYQVGGRQYVPVPAGIKGAIGSEAGGLTPDQVDLAKEAWAIKLAVLREQRRAADAATARANMPACDDTDELPNMAYIP